MKLMPRWFGLALFAAVMAAGPAWPMTEAERKAYLEKLLRTLPEVPTFRRGLDLRLHADADGYGG